MKVKAESVLTNISHDRIKEVYLTNDSFIIDCYTFIFLNLNPFCLEQKFEDVDDRQNFDGL